MNVTMDFVGCSLDELKALLDGGTLTVYSVARPIDRGSAGRAQRNAGDVHLCLARLRVRRSDGVENPVFAANPVPASSVGTPGFARARKADGTVVADFSAGPGDREIKFSEVSFSQGAPVKLTTFKFIAEGGWPEQAGILRHPTAHRLSDADGVTPNYRPAASKLRPDVSLATFVGFLTRRSRRHELCKS